MQRAHDKIIAKAAKAELAPLGFHRKGRSRLWFADHGWWLTVIEFQPSAWSKGSYLNVAAHWLWSKTGVVSFDYGGRLGGFIEHQTDAQFAPAAAGFAAEAAIESKRLAGMFSSLSETANILPNEARRARPGTGPGHPGWNFFNAGVAAALDGRGVEAAEMFKLVLVSFRPPESMLHSLAERMTPMASDQAWVRQEILGSIADQRRALKLTPLPSSFSF